MMVADDFSYLNGDDLMEFKTHYGTENEYLLVAGSRTRNRLKRYMPEIENLTLRVIFTAVVRDFGFPSNRLSFVIAITVYSLFMEDRNVTSQIQEIVTTELDFVLKHLMDEEVTQYEKGLSVVTQRWNEYICNPKQFVL